LKQLFSLLLLFHGIIHILGFVKAFKFADITQFTQNISKSLGVLWLISALFFILTAFFVLFTNITWWWMLAIPVIITSQILILISWHDAKYGTALNIIILIVVIFGIAN
jgi:hypothetical protein